MFTEIAAKWDRPFLPFTPAAPIQDRGYWEGLGKDIISRLIADGEAHLPADWGTILATDYLEFSRTGNREHFEDKQFSRRTLLNTLVLAECAENKGRFLDDIVNGIYAICGEAAWQLPAHNSYVRDTPQLPLPDTSRPVIDLFAAETGAVLAAACYCLRPVLDGFGAGITRTGGDAGPASPAGGGADSASPVGDGAGAASPAGGGAGPAFSASGGAGPASTAGGGAGAASTAGGGVIRRMVEDELDRRIFTPYLTEHFWWMGDGKSHMNNWTVWCTQNVLLAAALSGLDDARRSAVFIKACRSIDYFLAEYGEDGCCDEGAQYYRHAGLCLFGCTEILNGMTGGFFEGLYQEPKVRNIAAYIQKVHVAGPYYINFSDCSPVAGRCGGREFLFGKRTENPSLMRLAAEDYASAEDPLLAREHNLFYRLQVLSCHGEMTEYLRRMAEGKCVEGGPGSISRPSAADGTGDIFYPSVGLFVARDKHFCLAAKAGDNDDSHNHNDTGSFTLYRDGQPMFIDIGVETYQKKTFSPQRYEIWTMQSQYHNLPTFTGCSPEDALRLPYGYAANFAGTGTVGAMEHNGLKYAARDVSWKLTPETAEISMELAGTYPDVRVRSYRRSIFFRKGSCITISDHADCAPLAPVLSLITYEQPGWDGRSEMLTVGSLGACRIEGAVEVSLKRLPITDKRLRTAWKHDIWRVLVRFVNEVRIVIREPKDPFGTI